MLQMASKTVNTLLLSLWTYNKRTIVFGDKVFCLKCRKGSSIKYVRSGGGGGGQPERDEVGEGVGQPHRDVTDGLKE